MDDLWKDNSKVFHSLGMQSLSGLVEQLEREIPMLQQRQQEARALKQQQEADSKAKERQNQEQLKKEIDIKRKK